MNILNSLIGRILKVFKYGEQVHPTRDWLVLIAVAVIVFVLSLGYNVLLFLEATKEYIPDAEATPMSSTDFLEEVRSVFEQRAETEKRYRTEQVFIDPSRFGR